MGSCHCIQILRVGVQMMGPDFSVVPSDRTRDRRHKSKHRKCSLSIRKNLFTLSVTERWNRLSREVLVPPYLEMFKTCLE